MDVFQLNHIAVHTDDLENCKTFYRDVLKLTQIPRPKFAFDGAWFSLGPNQELHIIAGRTEPVTSNSRGTHVALQVSDFEAAMTHLESIDIPYQGPQDRPDGAKQIFVTDPDGHIVELTNVSTARAEERVL